MSLDLREELERITTSLQPNPDTVHRARSLGRRRLLLRRTKSTIGGVAVLALVGAAFANLPASWLPSADMPIASDASSGASPTSDQATAVAVANRKAEAQQRCWLARASQPSGTALLSVSGTTVGALRDRSDASRVTQLGQAPWVSLGDATTAAWCTFKTPGQYLIVAATQNGASITYQSSDSPLSDPGADGPPSKAHCSAIQDGTPPASALQIGLPNPAPGFPVRMEKDGVAKLTDPVTGVTCWARLFSVTKTAPTEKPAGGDMTGSSTVPTGPQVTVTVSQATSDPVSADGTVDGDPVVDRPQVAGVTSVLTRHFDSGDGSVWWQLRFDKGGYSVVMTASETVTVQELRTLADAISGL